MIFEPIEVFFYNTFLELINNFTQTITRTTFLKNISLVNQMESKRYVNFDL